MSELTSEFPTSAQAVLLPASPACGSLRRGLRPEMRAEIEAARRGLGDPNHVAFSLEVEAALAGAGLPLDALLRLHITDNPHVRLLLDDVSGHHFTDWSSMAEAVTYDCDATAMLDGHFLWHQPAWPADLGRYDLFVEWCDRGGARFAGVEPVERAGRLACLDEHNPAAGEILRGARHVAQAIRARYEAMIALLRTGELEAFGHLRGGEPACILPPVWLSRDTRISFVNSSVLKLVGVDRETRPSWAWPHVRVERTEPVWLDVVVRRPTAVKERPVSSCEQTEKDKGGKPPEYLWDEAYDLLVIELGESGFPGSGKKADLARMLLDCFQSIRKAKVPSEGTASDWLRDRHPRVWNHVKSPPRTVPKGRPVK